jgi:hypothetical protein
MEQLCAKVQVLEQRLDGKREQLLQRELLLEEVATEYALPESTGPSLAAQRRQQVEALLLVLPCLRVWQPQAPPRFQGRLERS